MNIQQKNHTYKRKIAVRNTSVVLGCALLLVISFIISMNTGYTRLSPFDTLHTLFGGGTDKEKLILFDFRLPRIVISMLVGAGLALSGCIIQGISKNPLADPGLLGIHAGAGITAAAIYGLAFKKGEGIAPMRLILTGVAVQAGISALTTVLAVKLDETQYSFVASWQAGSIWGSSWKFVLALLPWLLLLIPYAVYKSRVLDVLNLGDDVACGLGAPVERERRRLLAASVALAAACVAVSGSISFVGLITPHLARRLVGPRHSILLPVCGLTGAVLVSAADTAARVIVQPSEIPTGIMVAVIGAPYFLYLLAKSGQ
ncbi:iron ABC transporter permease [Lachnospiraceae bacterium 54-53]